ncbi:hypothetical protein BDV38DRAFT_262397 [Aspergillus pseudotamarii]|uniref:Uncharacterized protein n=1 Tax=Aspergillus pseudotamarii TaxID=132259 RepID=A0A5N6SBE3_ASPPS|nr:uncharacterized protein BDV38DRAFT_262397 [Aspergillus pseudotamarii]KAE8132038.1 hypothetical protein BDV38DRAFT_262397 [Aspergillus pseudotamarii]
MLHSDLRALQFSEWKAMSDLLMVAMALGPYYIQGPYGIARFTWMEKSRGDCFAARPPEPDTALESLLRAV